MKRSTANEPTVHSIQVSHFADVIGLEHREAPEGTAVIEMPIKAHLLNRFGTVHGGVVMALIDAAGLWAGAPKKGVPAPTSTVSLNCNFLRAARFENGRLHASAEVTKRGRALYFASITVRSGSNGPMIASGQGVYSTAPVGPGATAEASA
jgi:uncharacterized protein (TIGR00369 family)